MVTCWWSRSYNSTEPQLLPRAWPLGLGPDSSSCFRMPPLEMLSSISWKCLWIGKMISLVDWGEASMAFVGKSRKKKTNAKWVNNSSNFLTGTSLVTWQQLRTWGVQTWRPLTSSGAKHTRKKKHFLKVGYVGDQLLLYFKVFKSLEKVLETSCEKKA